jgi:type IV secretory pathway VirB10-like protein
MIPSKRIALLCLLLSLAVIFSACSASATVTPEPATPTEIIVPTSTIEPTATDLPPTPTEEVIQAPTDVPVTEEPTPTEEAPATTAGGSETCIACHTSQETLETLAEVLEVKSEVTSGEG